jgi:hypothetical protein
MGQVGWQEVEKGWEEVRQKEMMILEQSGRMNVKENFPGEQMAVQNTQTSLPYKLTSVKGQKGQSH